MNNNRIFARSILLATACLILSAGASAQTINSVVARSLFADKKAFYEGDIITVLIMEFTEGASESNTRTNSDNRLDADANISGGMTDFLPSFGLNSTLANRHLAEGTTKSRGTLNSKMTAIVTEVLENGLLSIQGTRMIEINGEKQTTMLTGVIRPEDVHSNNTVYSFNIANAQISYTGKGMVTQAGKPGIVARVWNWIF